MDVLSRVFENWSGATMKQGKRQKRRVEGKEVDVAPIEFVPLLPNIWEGISN